MNAARSGDDCGIDKGPQSASGAAGLAAPPTGGTSRGSTQGAGPSTRKGEDDASRFRPAPTLRPDCRLAALLGEYRHIVDARRRQGIIYPTEGNVQEVEVGEPDENGNYRKVVLYETAGPPGGLTSGTSGPASVESALPGNKCGPRPPTLQRDETGRVLCRYCGERTKPSRLRHRCRNCGAQL